jgi:cell division protease FtsH
VHRRDEEGVKTTFHDVAGLDEAVTELSEIKEFLENPKRYRRIGARPPHGVLLVGPPGTGKTLLARALAGETGVPFFHLSGADFVEMFAGMGAARVRALFDKAKKKAPSIVFIDEIDALGKTRIASGTGSTDEREQTLNALLVELDGFDENPGVCLIAATNRAEMLDPALMRAGRFDRQVVIDPPDRRGRLEILKVHARGKRMGESVDLAVVAQRTVGLSGADLMNIMNEAAILAARADRKVIEPADLEEAIDRSVAGIERRSRILSPAEREISAYHEAGHAVLAEALEGADPVHKVTIVPRGAGALGMTLQRAEVDRYLQRRGELLDRVCVLFGGRVAEDITFGDVTTGAAHDLEQATSLARAMVARFGMSDRLGLLSYADPLDRRRGGAQGPPLPSQPTAREIDLEVKRFLDEQYARAKALLLEHQDALKRVAARLLELESLTREQLLEALKAPPAPEPTPEPAEEPTPAVA